MLPWLWRHIKTPPVLHETLMLKMYLTCTVMILSWVCHSTFHMTVNVFLLQEIYKDRKKFSEQVFKVASSDLVNMGISVVSYTLKDVHDDQVTTYLSTTEGNFWNKLMLKCSAVFKNWIIPITYKWCWSMNSRISGKRMKDAKCIIIWEIHCIVACRPSRSTLLISVFSVFCWPQKGLLWHKNTTLFCILNEICLDKRKHI